jgi:hypothetical protein
MKFRSQVRGGGQKNIFHIEKIPNIKKIFFGDQFIFSPMRLARTIFLFRGGFNDTFPVFCSPNVPNIFLPVYSQFTYS